MNFDQSNVEAGQTQVRQAVATKKGLAPENILFEPTANLRLTLDFKLSTLAPSCEGRPLYPSTRTPFQNAM